MHKITMLALLALWVGCGGGQKPDGLSKSGGPTEYAPLPDDDAAKGESTAANEQPPASEASEDGAATNEVKKAPTDEQKKLLEQAEADLSSMVDRICACPDKKCLEALQVEFQSFGSKYRELEDVQIPKDTLSRMMQLGQRVTECTQKIGS